jgi:hypothetical protein
VIRGSTGKIIVYESEQKREREITVDSEIEIRWKMRVSTKPQMGTSSL